MKNILVLILFCLSCNSPSPYQIPQWIPYDESAQLAANADHEIKRMRYKLIQSKFLDKNDLWKVIQPQLKGFSTHDYERLKPLIFEQHILYLRQSIIDKKLSFKELTQWYLFRIVQYENDPETALNCIISINPNAVAQAEKLDESRRFGHPICGMPILVKDNINTSEMKTTAGAHVLRNNITPDAYIIEKIKDKGGIILGKTNLSEWAYYFCQGCPVGYSALGGQTLNPYGRKKFESGGSSSGSGASVAANFAVAALGTETSGSILSPASQNSIVGLKPTVGYLNGSGIIPISSTLDTPGPMTRCVEDNAIVLDAMMDFEEGYPNWGGLLINNEAHRLTYGVNSSFLKDSVFASVIRNLKDSNINIIEFEAETMDFDGFGTLLSAEMKVDLPKYLKEYGDNLYDIEDVESIVDYNLTDSSVFAPYGQAYFKAIVQERISSDELMILKSRLESDALNYFNHPMDSLNLDAILSINNWNAGHAALAKYPCLTLPIGYKSNGEPLGLTIITKRSEDRQLLEIGALMESLVMQRVAPAIFN